MGFLTVDGSPHCIQVHFPSKYLKRILQQEIKFEHFVIDKNGDTYQVEMEIIRKSMRFAPNGRKLDI